MADCIFVALLVITLLAYINGFRQRTHRKSVVACRPPRVLMLNAK